MADFNNDKLKGLFKKVSDTTSKAVNETAQFVKDNNTEENRKKFVEKTKSAANKTVDFVSEKTDELKENDTFKDVVSSVSTACKDAKDSLNESETFNNVKGSVNETFTTIKNDEKVKSGLKSVKTNTLKFTKSALNKVEKALEQEKADKDEEVVIHNLNEEK